MGENSMRGAHLRNLEKCECPICHMRHIKKKAVQ